MHTIVLKHDPSCTHTIVLKHDCTLKHDDTSSCSIAAYVHDMATLVLQHECTHTTPSC